MVNPIIDPGEMIPRVRRLRWSALLHPIVVGVGDVVRRCEYYTLTNSINHDTRLKSSLRYSLTFLLSPASLHHILPFPKGSGLHYYRNSIFWSNVRNLTLIYVTFLHLILHFLLDDAGDYFRLYCSRRIPTRNTLSSLQ